MILPLFHFRVLLIFVMNQLNADSDRLSFVHLIHSFIMNDITMTNGSNAAGASTSTSMSTQVVIGSMGRAEEYGSILTELKSNGGNVQGEMVDRVLDRGKSCHPQEKRREKLTHQLLPSLLLL
jgi:hypothetical protein